MDTETRIIDDVFNEIDAETKGILALYGLNCPQIAFVAGRYSGKTRAEVDLNIQAAKYMSKILTEMGYFVFCPHMNSAHFDDIIEMPLNHYYAGDLAIMIKACDVVVCVPGWKESVGSVREVRIAESMGIAVYKNIDEVPYPEYANDDKNEN